MNTRTRAALTTSMAVLAAAALASCADDEGSSGGSGANIKIMTITQAKAASYTMAEVWTGAEAGVRRVNAAGGVDGRQIQLIKCDDGGNPNQAASCARQAVKEKVSAVVGSFSQFGSNIVPLLQKAGIAYIAPSDITPAEHASDISFPVASGASDAVGVGMALAQNGCRTPAIIHTDNASSTELATFITKGFAARGAAAPKIVKVPINPTDVAGPVAQALDGGTQCVALINPPQDAVKILVAIRQSGKKITVGSISGVLSSGVIAGVPAAVGNGVLVGSSYFQVGTPQAKAFEADMNAVDPKANKNTQSMNGYVGVLIFAQAAKKAGATDSKAVLEALRTIQQADTGQLTGKIDFTKPSGDKAYPRVFNFSTLFYKAQNQAYTPLDGKVHDTRPAFGG